MKQLPRTIGIVAHAVAVAAAVAILGSFAVGLFFSSSAFWYRRSEEVQVRPWLKVRFHKQGLEVPHVLRSDKHEEVLALREGLWSQTMSGKSLHVTPMLGEGCVLITTSAPVDERAVFMCAGARRVPVSEDKCPGLPEVEMSGRFAWCTHCSRERWTTRRQDGGQLLRSAECVETVMTRWTASGEVEEVPMTDWAQVRALEQRPPLLAPSWY
jgi:hypothetical protein